jgi:serine/threonine-protein kinase
MSPEQIEALPLDRRTDLFSTGIVLYELVTGKRLFSGGDEFETMRRVLRGEIPDVSKIAPGVPEGLDPVIRKALARAPDDRYATALEFQQAIAHAVPPASTPEVGALVSRLGAEALQRIRTELDVMLGLDVAKGSRGAPKLVGTVGGPIVSQSTKGKTLPTMPALGAVPARRAIAPRLVLAEADGDLPEPEVGDVAGVPSRKSNVRLLALVLGLVMAAVIVAYQAFSMPYFRR